MDSGLEEESIDPYKLALENGFNIEDDVSGEEGTWRSTILKNGSPLIGLFLDRNNNIKTSINTEMSLADAIKSSKGYYRGNAVLSHPPEQDESGRTIIKPIKQGPTFIYEERGPMLHVEISLPGKDLMPPRWEKADMETYLQRQLRPISTTVGQLEAETPHILINNLFARGITAIMSERLPFLKERSLTP